MEYRNKKTDQFSCFKGKVMKNVSSENSVEQIFCPVGDHRGYGLVERTTQTIKRRLGLMLLDDEAMSKYNNRRSILE